MRVKKFEAKTMKDALTMVKHELGPDAVILSARDNRKSFGLGGEASVEITAAVSESTLQKKRFVESRMTAGDRARFNSADARTQRQIITKMVERRMEESQPKERRPITSVSYIDIPDEVVAGGRRSQAMEKAAGRRVTDLLDGFEQDFDVEADQWQQRPTRAVAQAAPQQRAAPQSQRPAARPQPPARPPVRGEMRNDVRNEVRHSEPTEDEVAPQEVSPNALSRIRSAAREAWRAGIFTTDEPQASSGGVEMVPQAAPPPPAPTNDREIASLKSEIDRLNKVLEGFQKVPQTFTSMHPGADFGIPYDLSFMFQKLTESGVTVDHAVDLLTQAAKDLDPLQMKKKPIVDAWVARWILTHVQTSEHPFQGRVHLFVGGSGSGKTSTLVKVASHLVVKEKKKVAILTTDAYKVGAVDQLKIYCQILNVPFAVIRNRKDWEWVLGQLGHVDHVLVDFPGFQLRDLDEIHVLKSLLPPPEAKAVAHFCVSATTKDGDAYEIARRYKVADYQDLIFTNLDQSVQHGIIYNVHRKTGKPLHSFGIGNRIPEDFELASKERVLDLIFKLTKLKRETK